MRGFITEQNFDEAESAFPGIVGFYRALDRKPGTFLELVFMFCDRRESFRPPLRNRGERTLRAAAA